MSVEVGRSPSEAGSSVHVRGLSDIDPGAPPVNFPSAERRPQSLSGAGRGAAP